MFPHIFTPTQGKETVWASIYLTLIRCRSVVSLT
jgi:hypothetical protein